jgi:hypothetical protein
MTPTNPDARRWQLIAYVSLALLLGYIAGQLSPVAGAQSPQPTRITTVGCYSMLVALESVISDGGIGRNGIITAAYVDGRETVFVYTFC